MKAQITRKISREQLKNKKLSKELQKTIKHYFPGLNEALKNVKDKRNRSYIKYPNHVILMTRIIWAISYISSMRKGSEEFNTETAIKNIGRLCGENLEEIPYWETINNYLKQVNPCELQKVITDMVRHLQRCKVFDNQRILGKYWQIIIDGTQLHSSRNALNGGLYRIHNKGTEKEYTEYYTYVLEAKLVLHSEIVVSIMSEFVENNENEITKQDCEIKASKRLMERLKQSFPRLPICITADSLYACDSFISQCEKYNWKYILRFKEGSIPSVASEFHALKKQYNNLNQVTEQSKCVKYDYVPDIDYNGHVISYIEQKEINDRSKKEKIFSFLTNFKVSKKKTVEIAEAGRNRWKIENEGFNTQKRHGYNIEHRFSHDYIATKNHYYLIQIAHMISQVIEAWKFLWNDIKLSREQKHRRILESLKTNLIPDLQTKKKGFQIRFC